MKKFLSLFIFFTCFILCGTFGTLLVFRAANAMKINDDYEDLQITSATLFADPDQTIVNRTVFNGFNIENETFNNPFDSCNLPFYKLDKNQLYFEEEKSFTHR